MPAPRLAPLAVPLAVAAAGASVAALHLDRSAAASTLFFSLLAAGVLAPLAATAARTSRVVPAAGLAAAAALAFLPRGMPLAPAVVGVVLVAALGFALAERVRGAEQGALDGRTVLALALAAQLAARARELLLAPMSIGTILSLTAVPLAVAWALAAVARRRPAAAAALGLATVAAGPGWDAVGTLAVLAGALLFEWASRGSRPRLGTAAVVGGAALPHALAGPGWLALAIAACAAAALAPAPAALRRAGAGALALAAAAALVAGGFPWLARPPLAAALRAAAQPPFSGVAQALGDGAIVLTAGSPRFDARLAPGVARGARALRVVTYLTHSTALACGTQLARVTVGAGGRDRETAELEVGRDSAEWAAGRPDVANQLACPPPEPHFSWVPAEGRYLGSTYAARFAWSDRFDADALRIERDPRLPEAVAVAIFFVGVER